MQTDDWVGLGENVSTFSAGGPPLADFLPQLQKQVPHPSHVFPVGWDKQMPHVVACSTGDSIRIHAPGGMTNSYE
jgi:hypothetical protein